VLRKIFGPKRDEVTGYFITSGAEHVVQIRDIRNA
jgi:hypothetical protein